MDAGSTHVDCRAVRRWLVVCMALVALMVLVGGLTRLTESGLSIVQWKLVTGTLPPLSTEAWQAEFAEYQTSPQYQQVNRHFTLADFQRIYWLEYLHRLLGRIVGLVILLPWLVFVIRSQRVMPDADFPHELASGRKIERCGIQFFKAWMPAYAGMTKSLANVILRRGLAMVLLVALQGTVGWIMVASGLQNEPRVAPLKLALHLSLAFALFLLMLWTWWELRDAGSVVPSPLRGGLGRGAMDSPRPISAPPPRPSPQGGGSLLSALHHLLFALIFLQTVFGALVAGLRAGHSYNTYPRMDGQWIPDGLWLLEPWWKNHLESVLTVQFQHRTLAVLVVLGVVAYVAAAWKRTPPALRLPLKLALAAVALQFALGVATLLSGMNIALASAHQLGALLLLSITLRLVYHSRKTPL